jgi:ABC-2 type transport system ATP-binding protein
MAQINVGISSPDSADTEARVYGGTAVPVLELRGLSVRLGKREVLRDISGSFFGRTIGLLGPNGAGKSTLISTLLGFWPIAKGDASVLGIDIKTDVKRVRGFIGYMPENDSFISQMTAVSFIRLMAELSGLPSEMALERAHEALFYVGLGEARYRKLGTYSLGMKQLAKLAQAIVHGPKVLILDEPTNGLDPPARQRMIRLVREMRDSKEMHIIICSHLLKDIEETCEEVVILKQGRVVHQANLEHERRLNRRFLELELLGSAEAFVQAVETLGCECAPGAMNRLKVVLAEHVEVRDIYGAAAGSNTQIRRLNFRRDSLEEIFLRAMEDRNGGL